MYLDQLTDLQRELFVETAVLIVRSDEEIAAGEDELLDAISAETGVAVQPREPGRNADEVIGDLVEDVRSPTERRIFLMELAGVAVVDARKRSAEMRLLRRFAKGLGLSDELSDFVAYAEDVRDVAAAGRKLIAGRGT